MELVIEQRKRLMKAFEYFSKFCEADNPSLKTMMTHMAILTPLRTQFYELQKGFENVTKSSPEFNSENLYRLEVDNYFEIINKKIKEKKDEEDQQNSLSVIAKSFNVTTDDLKVLQMQRKNIFYDTSRLLDFEISNPESQLDEKTLHNIHKNFQKTKKIIELLPTSLENVEAEKQCGLELEKKFNILFEKLLNKKSENLPQENIRKILVLRRSRRLLTKRYNNFCNKNDNVISEKRLIKLEQFFTVIHELQTKIESEAISRGSSMYESRIRKKFDKEYTEISSKWFNEMHSHEKEALLINDQHHQNSSESSSPNSNACTLSEESVEMDTTESSCSKETLEALSSQIPNFSGNYWDWFKFRTLFDNLVHNNSKLRNFDKFVLLQAKLEPANLTFMDGIEPTDEDYPIVWELLNSTYSDTEKLKNSFFELLFDQPAVRSFNSLDLQRFQNNIKTALNGLKELNEPTDHWDAIILFHLLKKLDSNTLTLWQQGQSNNNISNLEQFMKFLDYRISELEECVVID